MVEVRNMQKKIDMQQELEANENMNLGEPTPINNSDKDIETKGLRRQRITGDDEEVIREYIILNRLIFMIY